MIIYVKSHWNRIHFRFTRYVFPYVNWWKLRHDIPS